MGILGRAIKLGGRLVWSCTLALLAPNALAAQQMECGQEPFNHPDRVAALVAATEPVFQEFPGFLSWLTGRGQELCVAVKMLTTEGYYEPESKRIVIDGSHDLPLQSAILVHELVHVRQYDVGTCPAPDLSMEEHARAIFAMEADASATSLVVAWTLRENGLPDLWDALSAWPMQRDIAEAFAARAGQDGDLSAAATAAFSQWYVNKPRVSAYRDAACSAFLDLEDQTHKLRGNQRLDASYFDTLCQLPDGSAYLCTDE